MSFSHSDKDSLNEIAGEQTGKQGVESGTIWADTIQKLSIIVPAYNEERGIKGVLDRLDAVLRGLELSYEIVVVDDGSADATVTEAQKCKVRLIRHEQNRGYGASLKTGIRHATGDTVLIMDADGSYPPEAIPVLLREAEGQDMVVGARGFVGGQDFFRRMAKWILKRLAGYLVETKIPDLNSGMRLFKRAVVMSYFHLLPSNFSFTTTITLALLSDGYAVRYVPIHYAKRIGRSKIRPVRDLTNFLMLIFRTIVYFNPLKVFLPISLGLCAAGIGVMSWRLAVYRDIAQSEVLMVLLGTQIGIMGLLADLVVRRLNWLGKNE